LEECQEQAVKQILAEAAIKSFAETGLIISEGHLSGTTSVIGKDKVGSADCLSLRGELKADGLSSKDFPSGVKVDEGKMRAVFRGCFPIERAGLSHSGGGDFSLSVRLLTPDGTRLQVTSIQKTDEIWNALEK